MKFLIENLNFFTIRVSDIALLAVLAFPRN